jgi:hypothetical protein
MNERLLILALESGLLDSRDDLDQPAFAEIIASVERFANLVAAAEREAFINDPVTRAHWAKWDDEIRAAEREACAQVAMEFRRGAGSAVCADVAAAIRQRSQS